MASVKTGHAFIACFLLSSLGAGGGTKVGANTYMFPSKTKTGTNIIKPAADVDTTMMQLTGFGPGDAKVNITAIAPHARAATKRTVAPAIAAGEYYTMILKSDGTVWMTGNNGAAGPPNFQQITYDAPPQPNHNQGWGTSGTMITGVQAISGYGYHRVVLLSDGSVWTHGDNTKGQLVDGTMGAGEGCWEKCWWKGPVQTSVQAVAQGMQHTVTLASDGSVWTGGYNWAGQLCDSSTMGAQAGFSAVRNTMAQVFSGPAQAVAAGDSITLVLEPDGTLLGAGTDNKGELGFGGWPAPPHRQSLVQIMTGVQAADGGRYTTVALKSDGSVWTTGRSTTGALMDPGNTHRYSFASVMTGAQAVAAAEHHTMVLKTDGSVWVGGGFYQWIEYGHTPVQIATGAQAIAAGKKHNVVLKSDGSVWTNGANLQGQLGTGDYTPVTTPSPIQVFMAQAPTPAPIPTTVPTPSIPTTVPTPSTPAPQPSTVPTGAPAPSPPPVSAKGDPHLVNIRGQRFDLMQPGRHTLVRIPRERRAKELLLVEAEAQRLGTLCADMYFQELNVTGMWAEAERAGGLHFRAADGAAGAEGPAEWIRLGVVELKVVHGHTPRGVRYLNFMVRHLGKTGMTVGGLMGEDDHTFEATPPAFCMGKLVNLRAEASSVSSVGVIDDGAYME